MCVGGEKEGGRRREGVEGSVSEHVIFQFFTDLFVNTFANFFVCVSILFPCVYVGVFVYEGVNCIRMCGFSVCK